MDSDNQQGTKFSYEFFSSYSDLYIDCMSIGLGKPISGAPFIPEQVIMVPKHWFSADAFGFGALAVITELYSDGPGKYKAYIRPLGPDEELFSGSSEGLESKFPDEIDRDGEDGWLRRD